MGLVRRTAIIAVHGVGTPEVGATARAVSGLVAIEFGRMASITEQRVQLIEDFVTKSDSVEPAHAADAQLCKAIVEEKKDCPPALAARFVVELETTDRADIYELHWAALSKGNPNLLNIATGILSIPGMVVDLGARALKEWHDASTRKPPSLALRVTYRLAQELLVWVLPTLTVATFVLVTAGLAFSLPAPFRGFVADAVALLGGVIAGSAIAYHRNTRLAFAISIVGGGALGAAVIFVSKAAFGSLAAEYLLAMEWAGLGLGAATLFLRPLLGVDESRWREPKFSLGALALVWLVAGYFLRQSQAAIRSSLVHACAHVLVDLWVLLVAFAVIFLLLSWASAGRRSRKAKRDIELTASGRALRTATLALGVAILGFDLVEATLLQLLRNQQLAKRFGAEVFRGLPMAYDILTRTFPACALLLASVVMSVAIWALAPSVRLELAASKPKGSGRTELASYSGCWLSTGLRTLDWLGGRLLLAALIVAAACWPLTLQPRVGSALDKFGLYFFPTVFLGAALYLRSPSSLRELWPGIAVLLDIGTYLRTPREPLRNVRASIVRRGLALHDFIRRQNYDQVVWIAHSQGTMVAIDVLRLADGMLEPMAGPTHLVTMGSPLRSLYVRFFPHGFAWARSRPGSTRGPDPSYLAVTTWTNLFTSGDYIGRSLWHPLDHRSTFDSVPPGRDIGNVRVRELCIGVGAHGAYWSNLRVAKELAAIVRGDAPSERSNGEMS